MFGSSLIDLPVMSLQTGSPVGRVAASVMDPRTLLIKAYKLTGENLDQPDDSYLRIEDIREFSNVGFIIDDSDELVQAEDVVQLKNLLKLGFSIKGLKAVSESGDKLGVVIDFTFETDTFLVVDLVIKRPLLKSLKDTELIVNRSKIIEIDNQQVIINSENETVSQASEKLVPMAEFINPFRKSAKEANSAEVKN